MRKKDINKINSITTIRLKLQTKIPVRKFSYAIISRKKLLKNGCFVFERFNLTEKRNIVEYPSIQTGQFVQFLSQNYVKHDHPLIVYIDIYVYRDNSINVLVL